MGHDAHRDTPGDASSALDRYLIGTTFTEAGLAPAGKLRLSRRTWATTAATRLSFGTERPKLRLDYLDVNASGS